MHTRQQDKLYVFNKLKKFHVATKRLYIHVITYKYSYMYVQESTFRKVTFRHSYTFQLYCTTLFLFLKFEKYSISGN